ncbi:MAG TPA: methyltransferase domain-containing protein [Candidatus Acidoferrales bacterium]|nr:methyltransferase domain-containing protein [Candidatus Acidoferrales bacterium]
MKPSDANQIEFQQGAGFYDRLAEHYDAHVTNSSTDNLARAAFQDLVRQNVPAGSALLDFGCGTGLDALEYARAGYRVVAYDTSAGMLAHLERRCHGEILPGQIEPCRGEDLLNERLDRWPPLQAITANFAVLNLIRDPAAIFDGFARRMAGPGWLIISILNPLHWSTFAKRTVGRRVPAGASESGGNDPRPCPTYVHSVSALRNAAKGFRLVGRANAGTFVRYDDLSRTGCLTRLWWGEADTATKRRKRLLWGTPAARLLGTFVFLVFRRDS